jgi:hypothetical protein
LKIRGIAEFTADFPDDQVDDGEEIVVFGGRGVAEAVTEILRRLDYEVFPPVHVPPYGWRLGVSVGPGRFMIQISDLGDCYVMPVVDRSPALARIFNRTRRVHLELLTGLHREILRDGRFHDVKWWDRYDVRGVSADEPVG